MSLQIYSGQFKTWSLQNLPGLAPGSMDLWWDDLVDRSLVSRSSQPLDQTKLHCLGCSLANLHHDKNRLEKDKTTLLQLSSQSSSVYVLELAGENWRQQLPLDRKLGPRNFFFWKWPETSRNAIKKIFIFRLGPEIRSKSQGPNMGVYSFENLNFGPQPKKKNKKSSGVPEQCSESTFALEKQLIFEKKNQFLGLGGQKKEICLPSYYSQFL